LPCFESILYSAAPIPPVILEGLDSRPWLKKEEMVNNILMEEVGDMLETKMVERFCWSTYSGGQVRRGKGHILLFEGRGVDGPY